MSELTEIEFNKMDGSVSSLDEYAGDVLLVVNVASQCGLTPQYEGLQQLHAELQGSRASRCSASPPTTSAAQEPGTDDEIAEFCDDELPRDVPGVLEDQRRRRRPAPALRGPDEQRAHRRRQGRNARPASAAYGMTPTEDPDVLWNFEKFVIARDGTVAARFAPAVTPDDAELRAVIEQELAKQ